MTVGNSDVPFDDLGLPKRALMRSTRPGPDRALEDATNEILRRSLEGVTRHSEKSDILTPWKQQERWRREVYTRDGVADPQVRKGMFHRAANRQNPELNSRDGVAPPRSLGSMSTFVQEHGASPDGDS